MDQDKFRGPFNGILSSHDEHTDVAWLVLACDLPLLDSESIRHLINERDASKAATSYATRKTKLPEPLVTIWEPDGLKAALAHMQTAESSLKMFTNRSHGSQMGIAGSAMTKSLLS